MKISIYEEGFVDTNILIDLLADRPPFGKFAIQLFDLAEKGKVKLFTSSHAFATTHYLLKKLIGEKELRALLYSLLDYVELIGIDSAVIKKSLLSKKKDFEDAIQIKAATSVADLNFIITRNLGILKMRVWLCCLPMKCLDIYRLTCT